MTAKKGAAPPWRETAIVVREDILAQAEASGLDISGICNRALAAATRMRYTPEEPQNAAPPAPVIVAGTGAPPSGAPVPLQVPDGGVHPVINADDPRAAAAVKQVPRAAPRKAPAALPGRISPRESAVGTPDTPPVPAAGPSRGKPEKAVQKKPVKSAKGTAIKRFIAEETLRGEEEAHLAKDALYQAFARWCREHRITPVPDRKAVTIALKNQYALREKTIDGEPSWLNIRLR